MPDPGEILESALARIRPVEQWTTGTLARNAQGQPVAPRDPGAVCWCAVGSLIKECNDRGDSSFSLPLFELLHKAANEIRPSFEINGITDLNDMTDHETVIEAYERAISNAQ